MICFYRRGVHETSFLSVRRSRQAHFIRILLLPYPLKYDQMVEKKEFVYHSISTEAFFKFTTQYKNVTAITFGYL